MKENVKSITNLIRNNIYFSILIVFITLNIFIPIILILQFHIQAVVLYPIKYLLIDLFNLETINESHIIDYSNVILLLIITIIYIQIKKDSIFKFIFIFLVYHFFMCFLFFSIDFRHLFNFINIDYLELVSYHLTLNIFFIIYYKILNSIKLYFANKSM